MKKYCVKCGKQFRFSSPCSGNYVKLGLIEGYMSADVLGFSSPCSGNYVKRWDQPTK